jgi:hypothetical protein
VAADRVETRRRCGDVPVVLILIATVGAVVVEDEGPPIVFDSSAAKRYSGQSRLDVKAVVAAASTLSVDVVETLAVVADEAGRADENVVAEVVGLLVDDVADKDRAAGVGDIADVAVGVRGVRAVLTGDGRD